MNAPNLTADEAANLYEGPPLLGDWERLEMYEHGASRWHSLHWLVLRHMPTDTTWGLPYGYGLSERQEHDLPWEEHEDVTPFLVPLASRQIMRTEYYQPKVE